MRIAFLLLVLIASRGGAQDTTTHLVLPSYGGVQAYHPTGMTSSNLACWRFPARLGVAGATKLAAAIAAPTPFSAPCTAGFAIYTDTDDTSVSHRLLVASGSCVAAGLVTNTGQSPVNLVQATVYRYCFCMTNVNGVYLGIGEFNAAIGATKSDVMNNAVNRAALAAQPCAAGVPPTTTGVLTTSIPTNTITTYATPLMVVE